MTSLHSVDVFACSTRTGRSPTSGRSLTQIGSWGRNYHSQTHPLRTENFEKWMMFAIFGCVARNEASAPALPPVCPRSASHDPFHQPRSAVIRAAPQTMIAPIAGPREVIPASRFHQTAKFAAVCARHAIDSRHRNARKANKQPRGSSTRSVRMNNGYTNARRPSRHLADDLDGNQQNGDKPHQVRQQKQ